MSGNIKKTDINEKILNLIKPIVETEGMELVDVVYKRGPKGVLRIFIDKPGGVVISDCERISSRVGISLEIEEDLIQGEYVLEVSSPGLDRPLKSEADFRRDEGKLVRISLYAPLEGKKIYVGQVIGVQGKKVVLKEKSDKIINIPITDIAMGKLEIEF